MRDHQCLNQHASANILLEIIDDFNLDLAMESSSITWEKQHQSSILDLIPVSLSLTESLICCVTNTEWQYNSDHRPITTKIMLTISKKETQIWRCWKKVDEKKMQQIFMKDLSVIINMLFNTNEQIDTVVNALIEFIQEAIKVAVPVAKSYIMAKTHWNNNCQKTIRKAKQCQQKWQRTRKEND